MPTWVVGGLVGFGVVVAGGGDVVGVVPVGVPNLVTDVWVVVPEVFVVGGGTVVLG
jgi:hypothetical protein